MSRSINAGLPNPNKMQVNSVIDDLVNGDLIIQKANLYIEKMFINHVYHQILYVCAKGSKNAYHFIFDRAMRDHTHENIHSKWEKFKRYTINAGDLFKTLVRVVYFAKSATCEDVHVPSNHYYSPKKDIIPQGRNNSFQDYKRWIEYPNNEFNLNGSLMTSVPPERSSFKKLYVAIQRYSLRYNHYLPDSENCQHFATGFYNYLTNQSIPYVNSELMGSLPKEPFSDLFSNENDALYYHNVAKRIKEQPKKNFMDWVGEKGLGLFSWGIGLNKKQKFKKRK